jgi:hypothetical protein
MKLCWAKIFYLLNFRIVGKSPVFDLFCQNVVLGPPFDFEPPVLGRGGPGTRIHKRFKKYYSIILVYNQIKTNAFENKP